MASEKLVMVCSIYDLVAKEHGPLFFAANEGLLWRNVDGLMKTVAVSVDDFLVCVHTEVDLTKPDCFDPENPSPKFFKIDRSPAVL